jgi:hypothetical protein
MFGLGAEGEWATCEEECECEWCVSRVDLSGESKLLVGGWSGLSDFSELLYVS